MLWMNHEAPQLQKKKILKMILNLVNALPCVQVFVSIQKKKTLSICFINSKQS